MHKRWSKIKKKICRKIYCLPGVRIFIPSYVIFEALGTTRLNNYSLLLLLLVYL